MRNRLTLLASLALCSAGVFAPRASFAAPPNDARSVSLMADCTQSFVGGTQLDPENCFETMASLQSWIQGRGASAQPLVVDIGPGTFGAYTCTNQTTGITFRGSGSERTLIQEWSTNVNAHAMVLSNCSEVEFQHLKIEGRHKAISWHGSGRSRWFGVEVVGRDYVWSEYDGIWGTCGQSGGPTPSVHWSWDSRWIRVPHIAGDHAGSGYNWVATCSRNLFYGSEIASDRNGFVIAFGGDIRLYGSVIRIVAGAGLSGEVSGVISGSPDPGVSGGTTHMHGTIVVADGSAGTDVNAIGIRTYDGSVVHTLDTSFKLVAKGSGYAARLESSGGTVEAPSLLAPSTDVPAAGGTGGYWSLHGQDLYVETDCASDGDCDGAGTQTHLMVYNESCADNWFNTTTRACRGVIVP